MLQADVVRQEGAWHNGRLRCRARADAEERNQWRQQNSIYSVIKARSANYLDTIGARKNVQKLQSTV